MVGGERIARAHCPCEGVVFRVGAVRTVGVDGPAHRRARREAGERTSTERHQHHIVEVLVDAVGEARSTREAPEIDGVIEVPEHLAVGEFHTVRIVDAMGPDRVADSL